MEPNVFASGAAAKMDDKSQEGGEPECIFTILGETGSSQEQKIQRESLFIWLQLTEAQKSKFEDNVALFTNTEYLDTVIYCTLFCRPCG